MAFLRYFQKLEVLGFGPFGCGPHFSFFRSGFDQTGDLGLRNRWYAASEPIAGSATQPT